MRTTSERVAANLESSVGYVSDVLAAIVKAKAILRTEPLAHVRDPLSTLKDRIGMLVMLNDESDRLIRQEASQ